ncbi:MAG TPA: response regulator transcription factor [Pseudonocardia sp.]|nr:response regulator transcription factor [Pseudonocardia sp.]
MTRTGAEPGPRLRVLVVDSAGPSPPTMLSGPGVESLVDVVGRTGVPAEAARLAVRLRPQLVVVDLDSGAGALSAIGAIAAAAPQVPMLAVAVAPANATVLAAVRAGANSLVRTGETTELVAAVSRTAGGETVFSPGLAGVVLAEVAGAAGSQAATRRLTDRETDVIRLVVEGLTARQIGTRLGLSPRTVENHLQHVLRKLQLSNRAALIRYAIESGLA